MSDNRLVDFDKKRAARVMTTAVAQSYRLLAALTVAHHRGPNDTWTAARDRAAETAGIERSYAARIWNRWQDMKDVSGEAFMRLSVAYEAQCLRNEQMAALHRRRREDRVHGGETGEIGAQPLCGVVPLPPGSDEAASTPVPRAG